MLASFLYSQLTGGVKLSPAISINKDATAIWDCDPPNVNVSVLQEAGAISHTNNSRMSQSFTGRQGQVFVTPWALAHHTPLSMGILQARILEWVAMPAPRGSSRPRDRT